MAAGNSPAELWRKHGNKILIVLVAAALTLFAVNYRHSQAQKQAQIAQSTLADAWTGLDQLQQLRANSLSSTADFRVQRERIETDVNQAVQLVLDSSDPSADSARVASAWLARGELFWGLAQLPAATPTTATTTPTTASSTTPPAAPGKTPQQYLDLAANAYQKIVSDYSNQALPVHIARFGLAAIAEDKRDAGTARTQYRALLDDTNLTPTLRSMAETRLAQLNDLEKPLLLLPATQPIAAAMPSIESLLTPTADMRMGPTTMPSTTPASTMP